MGHQVQIGDQTIDLGAFSGFKAIEASATVAEITSEVPELYEAAAAFRAKYIEQFGTRVERATAELEFGDRAQSVSEEAWAAAGNVLKLEDEPSPQEIGIAVFHLAFRKARKRVVDLLAILLTPNSTFEENDSGAGDVDVEKSIADARKKVLHRATVDQLVRLAAVTVEVLEEQFDPVREDLGKLGRLLGIQPRGPKPATEEEGDGSPKSAASSSKTARGGGRRSSSGSRGRQAGRGAKSSTGSRGSSSSSSVPA